MVNLVIYNGNNSQEVLLNGLVDVLGVPVSTAVINGQLMKGTRVLTNGSMTFSPVAGSPGNYIGMLTNFDSPVGSAQLSVTGTVAGVSFSYVNPVTVAQRSI